MDDQYDKLFKIVLIGESGVGKTNLISRFVEDQFSLESRSTIGVEFSNKTIFLENTTIKVQLWDTAGQERFRAITVAYYRGAHGAIVVFDCTKRQTFERLDQWISDLRLYSSESVSIVIVGNKSDLSHLRAVSTEEAQEYAQRNGCLFMETSALDNIGVDQAFGLLVEHIYKHSEPLEVRDENVVDESFKIYPIIPEEKKKKSCCPKN